MATPLTIVELEDLLGPRLHDATNESRQAVLLERKYHVERIVGRGARGIVCKARDVRLDRDVAIKFYPAEPSLIREVESEAKALARLDHPNIVRVIDAGHAELDVGDRSVSCLYLVMSYIEGSHLGRWKANAPRSTAELLACFLAAGEGLHAAHMAGTIHRDVKPQNIMIDTKGVARLVDFGLARMQRAEVTSGHAPTERQTQFGAVMGTLEYMAPEARSGSATEASDQFSLAVAIWEAVCGTLPFDPHRGEWRLANSADFHGVDGLSEPLAAILRRALSYDPAARYPSIRGFLDALVASGRPRRRRAPLFVGLTAAAGLCGVVWGYGLLSTVSPNPEIPAPETLDLAPELAAEGDGTPAPAAPPSARIPTAFSDTECAAFKGAWSITTLATWAEQGDMTGARGYYRLAARPLAGCQIQIELRKLGDSKLKRYEQPWEDRAVLTPRQGAAGEVWYDGRFELSPSKLSGATDSRARAYQFHFLLRGDALTGDFESYAAGRTDLRGVLRGARSSDDATAPRSVDSSDCESQCRLRCAGASASCIASMCETSPRRVVTTCPR